MYRNLIAIAAIFVLTAGLASAITIGPTTTTTPITATFTDWGNTGADNPPIPSGVNFLTFGKFNPALGSLTQVEIQLSTGFDTVLTITNTLGGPSSGNARTEVQVAIGTGTGAWLQNSIDVSLPKFFYSLAAGDSIVSGHITGNVGTDGIYTGATELGLFTGTGDYQLPIGTFTNTLVNNSGGNTDTHQSTFASATGDVTYTYTPAEIPEPATMALLGSALVGLALLGRKRLAR